MASTRSSIKRQRVASAVESALANIDVVSQLAVFLDANDLCQVRATCRALGSTNDGAAFNGLSMAEEAARRVCDGASDEEKAAVPRYNGESWIELYHHLLMLRARLTFNQLVGSYIEYRGDDQAAVQAAKVDNNLWSHAICGNHIMRSGKHWATFKSSSSFEWNQSVGVIRPLPGWEKKGLVSFSPYLRIFRDDFLQEQTARWERDVHSFGFDMRFGVCILFVLRDENPFRNIINMEHWEGRYVYNKSGTSLGMLLDLDSGTLSVYQDDKRLGTLRDGLAGEYCWTVGFGHGSTGDVSIQRGYNVNIGQ